MVLPVTAAAPRVLRRKLAKEWAQTFSWSPRDLLGTVAASSPSISFTVKRSAPSNRFFMYEEHGGVKLHDAQGPTQVLELSSAVQLADLLHDTSGEFYYYWTSPVQAVAPELLTTHLEGYETLYHEDRTESDNSATASDNQQQPPEFLDPRGPSLWMGNSGSATQAHYDVADNILVQLHGTKRVRCYPPSAASSLYVFPDAHPRARKSQVYFDNPNWDLFPLFDDSNPVLDVVLQPGDAISIPAFWFHHVENGRIPKFTGSNASEIHDGPTVSLNLFSLSRPMMIAQQIFSEASRPLEGIAQEQQYQTSVAALRALGDALLKGLVQIEAIPSSEWDWVQTMLIDTRYAPLRGDSTNSPMDDVTASLSKSQEEQVHDCIQRILPLFAALHQEQRQDPDQGVLRLVVCHLFELWAVELVGAPHVADAWETVIRRSQTAK